LTTLKREDIELALIQFNGKSTHLLLEISKLEIMYKYNFLDRVLFSHEKDYKSDLQLLSNLTHAFNQAAKEYYVETQTKDEELEQIAKINLDAAFSNINNHINNILFKNIAYDQKKFYFAELAMIFTFILAFAALFWYKKRLLSIYEDIEHLSQPGKQKNGYTIFSTEADAIALRMNRRTLNNDNLNFLDPITEINNDSEIRELITNDSTNNSNYKQADPQIKINKT
jgi:hypothetical protein